MSFERFGKYLLLEKLAAGGMAEIYLAKTIGISNFVAIKRILPQFSSNPEFISMFKEEAKIASNLRHSNIVSIHYFGQENGQLYLVMDFVEGQNLRQLLNKMAKDNKQLSIEQIVYIAREVAAGLDYAHRALDNATGKPLNIIHRDMSPQNVMISFEGEVKIVDFGIAKAESKIEHTQAGTIKGKFSYMSPEQAEGEELDARTDIFALGVIMWELLSGERLFVGHNEAATLKKVRDCQIPSLRKMNPNIPLELERIVDKALAKNKEMRYASAQLMHKELNRFLNTCYPEFAKTDVSKFMKALYRGLYLDYRKKFAFYSQIQDQEKKAGADDKTKTLTKTQEATATADSQEPIAGLDVINQTDKIDIKNLKQDPQSKSLKTPWAKDLHSTPSAGIPKNILSQTVLTTGQSVIHTAGVTGGPSMTQVKSVSRTINTSELEDSSAKKWIVAAVTTLIMGSGAWFILKSGNKFSSTDPKALVDSIQSTGPSEKSSTTAHRQLAPGEKLAESPASQKIDQSSEAPVSQPTSLSPPQITPLNVLSSPMGAIVEINGKQMGLTPFRGLLRTGEKAQIIVRKDGYISFDTVLEPTDTNPVKVEAVLQPEPPKGYLSLQIIGDTPDTIVEINGRRVAQKEQLSLYPVPAMVPIRIRAYSPFGETEGFVETSVKAGEKKVLRIILKRKQAKGY